ncbi:MAG: prolipoprotein diacylglyceryl transferase [Desulfobacterales bacterium]|nr:MAG: prolipoprotein diacylglyceryl transferase [Desulfobacterales bacterium]
MTFPQIDPVIFSLGPLHVRWYGLMYVLGFIASYYLVKYQIRKFQFDQLTEHFENLNMTLLFSVIIGGRLGYVLFYNPSYYFANPLDIPATWHGGMSFHGACFTLVIAGFLFCRRYKLNFWKTADIYVATAPIGLFFGRIGNFINGELFGRVTEHPIGMIFPGGGPLPRHPSQIYEAFLEGIVLFIVLWSVKNRPWNTHAKSWPHGSILALFLIAYGVFRTIIENFREPDQQLGFILSHITMGQILSGIMIIAGALIWGIQARQEIKTPE